MKKKLVLLLAVAMVAVFALTACTSAPAAPSATPEAETEVATEADEPAEPEEATEAKSSVKIGFSMWDMANSYFASVRDGAQKKCDELGWELIVADPNNDVAQQVADMENFMAMNVDAIIVCAIDKEPIESAAKEAMEKGIKVIAQSMELENSDVFAACDDYEMGYLVGEGAGRWIVDNYGEDAEIECALLCYDSNTANIPRGDGMNDGILAVAPKAQIVARQDANTTALGQSVTDALLQANPKLQVITCQNDAVAMGVLSAVQGANRDNEEFCIIGLDNTDEARAAMAAGTSLRGTLDNQPYENGIIDVEQIQQLLNGEEVEWRCKIPAALITVEDL